MNLFLMKIIINWIWKFIKKKNIIIIIIIGIIANDYNIKKIYKNKSKNSSK